jgi:hypothetical protein
MGQVNSSIPKNLNYTLPDGSQKNLNDYVKRWDEVYRYLNGDINALFDGINTPFGEVYQEGNNTKTASSITLNTGTLVTGDVSDTRTTNQTYYQVNENAGVYPVSQFDVTFTLDNQPGRIEVVGRYEGSVAHNVVIYAYNYTTVGFDRFTSETRDFPTSSTDVEYQFDYDDLPGAISDYVNGSGESQIRIDHLSSGNSVHNFYLDYIAIFERGLTIDTANTYEIVTGFNEGLSNLVTVNADNGTFTIQKPGTYEVNMTVSFSGTDGADFESHVFVNGVKQDNVGLRRKLGSSGDFGTTTLTGLLDLSVNDVVDLRVTSAMAGDYASIENINFHIKRIRVQNG